MPPFRPGDDNRSLWERWERAFNRYLAATNITDDDQSFNLLLVLGGLELQAIYDKISKVRVEIVHPDQTLEHRLYDSALETLRQHFAPQLNKRFERHQMRKIRQEAGEGFEDFVFRVKALAGKCSYVDEDDHVVDQIIEGCSSAELRRRLLSEDKPLTEVIATGKMLEEVAKQSRDFERANHSMVTVGRISSTTQARNPDKRCDNCGYPGHYTTQKEKCPATNKRCDNCGERGHFKGRCTQKRKTKNSNEPPSKRAYSEKPNKQIYFVSTGEGPKGILDFKIGGVTTPLVVDPGSPANILTLETFEWLKKRGAQLLNIRDGDKIEETYVGYGSDEKIKFSAALEAEIKVPDEESGVWTHFLVAPRGQADLLSKGKSKEICRATVRPWRKSI